MHRLIDRLANGFLVFLGLVLLAMVALSVWNVFSRYLFAKSLLWADEIAVFAMIMLGWLGAILCAWKGMEIRMSVLSDMAPLRFRRGLGVAQLVLAVVLCGWTAWLSWVYVARLLRFGMTSDSAGIPVWIVHIAVTASLAAMAVIALYRLTRRVRGMWDEA